MKTAWPWESDIEVTPKGVCNTGIEIALLIGAGAALASTGVAVASSIQQSEQQQELAKTITQQKQTEAQQVRESAAFEEQGSRRQARLLLGRQRAIQAASGFDPGSGSLLGQEIDLVQQAELEALSIRRAGMLSSNLRDFEGAISRFRGDTARRNLPFSVVGGVLQGASSLANIGVIGTSSQGKRGTSALSSLMFDL